MASPAKSALDATEKTLVEQSRKLDDLNHRELTELARLLRGRRERVLRMIRNRTRAARKTGSENPDTGARDKKAELIAAIDRVGEALEARTHANRDREAPSNPKSSVKAKPAAAASKASAAKAEKKPAAKPEPEKTAPEKPAAKKAPAKAAEAKPAAAKPAAKKTPSAAPKKDEQKAPAKKPAASAKKA